MEDTVAAVWASVLRMDATTAATAITRDSDFFDLGGHSLLLVKVAAGLQSGTGLEVSVVCSHQLSSISRAHTDVNTNVVQVFLTHTLAYVVLVRIVAQCRFECL
eukprot:7197-Heterococcus_DN1.PRE.3